MRDHSYQGYRYQDYRGPAYTAATADPFGWLKTLAIVFALFAVMLASMVTLARADGCAGSCRASHNDCRVRSKGSPQCDAQLQACVQSCVASNASRSRPAPASASAATSQPRR